MGIGKRVYLTGNEHTEEGGFKEEKDFNSIQGNEDKNKMWREKASGLIE